MSTDIHIELHIYPSEADDESVIYDITQELEGSGYSSIWHGNYFECVNNRIDAEEPEVVFDNILAIDSKVKIQVRRCNSYWLRRDNAVSISQT